MGWPYARLSDVMRDARSGFASGADDAAGTFQVRMNNVTREGGWDLSKQRRVPATTAQLSRYSVKAGDVLFNATNSADLVGKSALVRHVDETTLFSNHFLRLRTSDSLESSYFAHWLRATFERGVFRGLCKQWVNQATVGRDALLALTLPMPPVEEQRRIADILDRADELRAKRRQSLTLLDELTQSIFLDMFGDPATNDHRWDRVPMADVVTAIENGQSPNCESRPATVSEWGVLKLGAVSYGRFDANENKAYLGPLGTMQRNEVRANDLLMTRKNTRELVGAAALVGEVRVGLLLPDLVFRLQVDEARASKGYLQALIMNARKRPQIAALSNGSAASMPNISKARLQALLVELPPIELQRLFVLRSAEIEDQRRRFLGQLAALDTVFASLQQRAFAGRL
jgi:type I restriction enzyme S subunit